MTFPAPPPDEGLPSYHSATSRNPFPLIIPYLSPSSILPCTLVSRTWHASFNPSLYASPNVHFSTSLTSFLLFLRTLSTRPSPETTSLDLSSLPPDSSVYLGPPTSWLHLILTQCPNLSSLNLSGFQFVDAASLAAAGTGAVHHHNLRKLKLADCPNATPKTLERFLRWLPGLRELDLSATPATRDAAVMRQLFDPNTFPELQSLGLRELGLRDEDLGRVLRGRQLSLRSLDVRWNNLGDGTVEGLLDWVTAPPMYDAFVGSAPEMGLTHLRFAGNRVEEAAVERLVKGARLETLDLGSGQGGVGIVPVLGVYAFGSLRTLRVGVEMVTGVDGLRRGSLKALETLILCAVPEWEEEEAVKRLARFICPVGEVEGDKLKLIELEMGVVEGEGRRNSRDGGRTGEKKGVLDGDFSFFDEEGTSGWGNPERKKIMGVLETVKKVRDNEANRIGIEQLKKRCRVRVVRDLGGRDMKERGSEGERWAVVREGM